MNLFQGDTGTTNKLKLENLLLNSSSQPQTIQDASADIAPIPNSVASNGSTWQILGFVYFTFICYLSIGLPLAVLPPYVHLRMGYSAILAGLVISIQYIATLASRPWAGRISDRSGAKISVLWGLAACTFSGVLLVIAAELHNTHVLSLFALIVSRLILGVGESLGSTGSTLWGITSAGPESTAKVISFNGISTYGAMAVGAPLGVVLDLQWGLASLGIVTILIGAISFVLAARKPPVPVMHGEHMPFSHVLGRVFRRTALATGALGEVSYSDAGHIRIVASTPAGHCSERRGSLPYSLRRWRLFWRGSALCPDHQHFLRRILRWRCACLIYGIALEWRCCCGVPIHRGPQ